MDEREFVCRVCGYRAPCVKWEWIEHDCPRAGFTQLSDEPVSDEILEWLSKSHRTPLLAWRYGNRLFYLGSIAQELLERRRRDVDSSER